MQSVQSVQCAQSRMQQWLQRPSALGILIRIKPHSSFSEYFPWISSNVPSEMVIKYFWGKIWVLTFWKTVFAPAGFSYAPLDVWQLQKVHHTEYIIISIDWSAQWKVFLKKFLQWNELQLRDRVLLLSRGAPTSLSPQLNWHSPKKIECRKN